MAEESTEDEESDDTSVVELGEPATVDGAPLARIASRLSWPQEKSEINRKEGESVIRTPNGPRSLTELLDESDQTYFARRQDFENAIREITGVGPVPTGDADG